MLSLSLNNPTLQTCSKCPLLPYYAFEPPYLCEPHRLLYRMCNKCLSRDKSEHEHCPCMKSDGCAAPYVKCTGKPMYPTTKPKMCLEHFLQLKQWNQIRICCICFTPTISGTYKVSNAHPLSHLRRRRRGESLYCCLVCMKAEVLSELTHVMHSDMGLIVSDYLFMPFPIGTILKTSFYPLHGYIQLYISAVDELTYTYHLAVREVSGLYSKDQFPD